MSQFFSLFIFIISFLLKKSKSSYIFNPLDLENNKSLNYINKTEISLQKIPYEKLKNIIEIIKSKPDILSFILINNNSDSLKNLLKEYMNETDLDLIINIQKNISKYPLYINKSIEFIKKNITILDYILLFENNTNGLNGIMNIFNDFVVNHKEIIEFFLNLIKKNKDFIDIIKIFIKNIDNKIIKIIKNDNYFIALHNLTIHLLNIYNNKNETVNLLSNFIKNNQNFFKDLLNCTFNNSKGYIEFFNDLLNVIADIDNEILSKIYDIFKYNGSIIYNFIDEINGNIISLIIKIPKLIYYNKELTELGSLLTKYFLYKEFNNSKSKETIISIIYHVFFAYSNINYNDLKNNLTTGCFDFLNYALLGLVNKDMEKQLHLNKEKNLSKFYIYKFLIDSTKNKNDILTYENCLEHLPVNSIISNYSNNIIEHNPTFIISMANFLNIGNKNNTSFEDRYYNLGFCLPQGSIKNKYNITNNTNNNKDNETYLYCTKDDYHYISLKIISIFIDINKANITYIQIDKNEKKIDFSFQIAFKLIPIFIFIFPFLIFLFLILYKKFIIRNKKDILMIDKQINTKFKVRENEKDVDNDYEEYDDIVNERQKKIIKRVKVVPKWYKLLNEFFNFKDNVKELFYFESNQTNINNIGALIYIKGLLGISIILTVFGQLYLIFFNLPMKEFGKYHFYKLLLSVFYIFPFIGLRYSPRIIFSCSGFTLTYKFLSFFEKESRYYLIKFFFRQIYKYLFLINLILGGRYSLNCLMLLFRRIKPMWKIFNENELAKPENDTYFFLNLLSIRSFLFNEKGKINIHSFIDYGWIAFNEVFFFTFGTILISIGYKFKLKIDYIIITLAIVIYLGKIIFFFIINYKIKYELYTTLYYYLFDYGIIMTNPLFNLPYFLIGMYFGLMNYCVQKGITSIKRNSYKSINIKNYNKNNFNDDKNEINRKSEALDKTNVNRNSFDDKENSNMLDKDDILKSEKFNKNNEHNKLSNINNEDDIIETNINDNNNYTKEIKDMPFLRSSINIIDWHRNHRLKCFFIFLLIFLSIIITFFIIIHFIILLYYHLKYKDEKDEKDKKDEKEIYIAQINLNKKLSLEDYISNPFLNFIYLIDIEIVVLFIQWGLFILYMKRQYFIIDFFNHIYWSPFNKAYFSFVMVCNPIILFIFYESETVVKLNLYNLYLYFFIDIFFIFIATVIAYITIELPLKKIFKYMIKKDYIIISNTEELNEEIEEDDEENEDEESEDSDNNNKVKNKNNE